MNKDIFYTSASNFARSGIEAHLRSEWEIFFVHSGTALELLCKAHLSSIHPTLVVDGKDFDSLLRACGGSPRSVVPLKPARTITVSDALTRSARLIPTLKNLDKDLRTLVDVRNGVIHAASLDESKIKGALVPYLKASELLLRDLDQTPDEYWAGEAGIVSSRLAEAVEDAKQRVSAKMSAAKDAYLHRTREYEGEALEAFLIHKEFVPRREGEEVGECPVCERRAILEGSHQVEWEFDSEWDVASMDGTPHVIFYPSRLKCPVCGLDLDGRDELEAAGLDGSLEIEDANPEDYETAYQDEYQDAY